MSLSAAARYLRDYVAIPSVNPMGRADMDAAIRGESRYAEHLHAQLARMGIDAVLVGQGERRSVVAHVRAAAPNAETVLVASHLDTVPVDGMTIDPFDPAVQGERMYGRGSCDTKGGMAALVAALQHLLSRGRLSRNLVLVGEADEEDNSVGIQEVLAHLGDAKPDWAIATEPTGMSLVTQHKGCLTARVVTHGRACHGSNPDAGDSAIYAIARAALAMEQEHARLRGAPHPSLGPATLSVGLVGGGAATNVVPDHAWLIVDRRGLPGEDEHVLRAELQAALANAGLGDSSEVLECFNRKDALYTPEDDVSVQRCAAALTALGLDASPGQVAFGTDAGPLSVAGIPSVVLGPGHIEQAHTKDEWIPLDQLDRMTDFFVELLG